MSSYLSIRIEGGLLGPELLDQVIAADVPGQKPADFGLEPKRNLTDEIAAVFADSRALWGVFKSRLTRLPENDLATTATRDQWVLPFLALLGYQARYNSHAFEVDGQTFAVSHRAGEGEDSPPIHVVGAGQELGRVPPSGRPRLAPHSLVQEYLNRTEHVWGIVTNGLTLRLLRDSTLVRRQAYIEFDLQAIFEEQRFHDFAALYRLIHRTRLPRGMADANECLLEKYHAQTIEQGGRVREHLRDGVEECLKLLGNGFLAHKDNEELRQKLSSQQLTPAQFYRQLFRIVYRFLFLLVSEDRGLISPNQIYRDHYGIARLRRMLDVQAAWTDHADLWLSLRTLWKLFGDDKLAKILDLAPLNGELFAPQTLDGCILSNNDLLHAFWHLAYYQERQGAPARRVNYSALDVEELGSVYESLLEFHPDIAVNGEWRTANGPLPHSQFTTPHSPAAGMHFDLIFGSERKTTGSFYTPPELVNELIESALMPVVRQRLEDTKRMANGEWRMVEEPFRTACWNYANQRLSRSGSLAAVALAGQSGVSAHQAVSQGGVVRHDLADSPGGDLHSGQHSGGLGTTLHGGVHPVSPQGQRQPDGTGNPSHDMRGRGAVPGGGSPAAAGGTANTGQTNTGSGTQPGEAASGESRIANEPANQPANQPANSEQRMANGGATPFATRHSPLTGDEVARLWRETPFAIRHSLFAAQAAQALLSLKIIDVACGSGHMLLAAGRRVGKELAILRTGEDEPAPERIRESIRDVISHCIYGVDRNPLAVDLCRVALWLESHTAGKPLTFLDHRIRCGDSLVGVFDLGVLKQGIPDKAFDPCEGDDKTVARSAAKRNKAERGGEMQDLFAVRNENETDVLSRHSRDVDAIPDDSPELIRRKKELFEASHRDPAWQRQKQACDLWTAAFFQNLVSGESRMANGKDADGEERMASSEAPHSPLAIHHSPIITSAALADHLGGRPIDARLHGNAGTLALRQPFFHWPLEFPEVFAASGFDVVLSNPPWEMINLMEQEFFAARDPQIAATTGAARKKLIAALPQTNPALHSEFSAASHDADCLSKFIRQSERYPLTAVGRINTYAVFAETIRGLLAPTGRAGIILPVGIATDDNTKAFYSDLTDHQTILRLVGFENESFIFPAIANVVRFCTLTIGGNKLTDPKPSYAFYLRFFSQLSQRERFFQLTTDDLALLNPNTRTCPVFRTRTDAEITRKIYQRVPVLIRDGAPDCSPWGVRFMQGLFNMTSDSHLFQSAPGEGLLPLYEGKLVWHYDHRFASYEFLGIIKGKGGRGLPETPLEKSQNPKWRIIPQHWVKASMVEEQLAQFTSNGWLMGFRRITSAKLERTAVFSFFPRTGAGDTLPILFTPELPHLQLCLLANLNSLAFDFVARQKVGGTHMDFHYLKQLPVLPPNFYRPADVAYVASRVLELVYTADDMQPLADALRASPHSPFPIPHSPFRWNEERRAHLRAELDAWYARAYGLTRDELRYILDPADVYGPDFPGETFRVLKEKELAKYGEYRTRRLVLEAWDKLPPREP